MNQHKESTADSRNFTEKKQKQLFVNTHRLLVPSPVIGGKCTCQCTLAQGNDEIHEPEPAKQMVDLHAEQMAGTDR